MAHKTTLILALLLTGLVCGYNASQDFSVNQVPDLFVDELNTQFSDGDTASALGGFVLMVVVGVLVGLLLLFPILAVKALGWL